MAVAQIEREEETEEDERYQRKPPERRHLESRHFLTRHSIKPVNPDKSDESKEYPGISEAGVRRARSSAKNIFELLDKSESGTVMFLSGVSEEIRTASTARVYGDELKKMLKDRKDYIVITDKDVEKMPGYNTIAEYTKTVIDSNPDKKIIVDIPLFLNELSARSRQGKVGWMDNKGKPTPYALRLIERCGKDQYKALRYWIEHNNPEIGGERGPDPNEIAKSYAQGVSKLEQFAQKYIGDRPLITGLVGHSWDADVYLAYLAGNGKVDKNSLDLVASGKGMIKETEMAYVRADKDMISLTYRNREHKTKRTLERIAAMVGGIGLLFSLLSTSGITGNAIGTNGTNIYGAIFAAIALACGILILQLRKKKKK